MGIISVVYCVIAYLLAQKKRRSFSTQYAECGPEGDPSCFGRQFQYEFLTLRGTIVGNDLANVPVPAAAWLLGSGLLCLLGTAKRTSRS